MSKRLHISDDLTLPLDAVTETFGILGRRGSGKSHTGSVMAEEMLKAGIPIIAYDPTGAWYGLKSSVDGKSPGFPVVIFGGEHEDVPLAETDGEMIARAIVAERFPAILDVSLLRKGARARLMADFLETLYHENREAVHFFADELHTIAPLMVRKGGDDVAQSRCVGAIEDIILQGRRRGLGMTGLSQRPALVNANVRSQFGTLVAMQIVAPLDRKAIAEWIAEKGTEEEGEKLLAQLPRLERGTGIVWSPTFDLLKTVTFRARETFDSGRTPGVGQKRVEPKAWAEINVARLGQTIAAKRDEKKQNDPKLLKAELAKLRKELEQAQAKPSAPAKEKRVEVPVVTEPMVKRIEKICDRLEAEGAKRIEAGQRLLSEAKEFRASLAKAVIPLAAARPAPIRPAMPPRAPVSRVITHKPTDDDGGPLPEGERKVLTAAAQNPDGASREEISILAGYKRSTRDAYIQRLSTRGFVQQQGDQIIATGDGMAALGDSFEPLPTGDALRDYWIQRLPEGERKCLEVVLSQYPNAVDREAIGETTGYKRSTRDAYLQRLGTRRLVKAVGRGEVVASETLFD